MRRWPPRGSTRASSACPAGRPSTARTRDYRDEVLPDNGAVRVAIEEGSTLGWERYVGRDGTILGMHTFGQSAPFADVEEEFGFTVENVTDRPRGARQGRQSKAGMEEER